MREKVWNSSKRNIQDRSVWYILMCNFLELFPRFTFSWANKIAIINDFYRIFQDIIFLTNHEQFIWYKSRKLDMLFWVNNQDTILLFMSSQNISLITTVYYFCCFSVQITWEFKIFEIFVIMNNSLSNGDQYNSGKVIFYSAN